MYTAVLFLTLHVVAETRQMVLNQQSHQYLRKKKLDKTQFYEKIADNSLLANLSLYCAVRMPT